MVPFFKYWAPSTEPVVEKAQQEPHWPWFLTPETAPSVLQSLEAGAATVVVKGVPERVCLVVVPRYMALNSVLVKSANWLAPKVAELPAALKLLAISTFCWKMAFLVFSSVEV